MKKRMIITGFFLAVSLIILLMILANAGLVSAENPSGEAIEIFITGTGVCNDRGWWDNGTDYVKDNCSYKAAENNGIACCPGYMGCNLNGTCSGWAKYCYQYTNQESCDWGSPKIISMNNANYTCGETILNGNCLNTYQCRCKWEKNKCMDVLKIIIDANPDKDPNTCEGRGTNSTCTWNTDILENNCNNSLNYIKVSKTASWVGTPPAVRPEGCKNMIRQDTCPLTAKLPFFGSLMMFVSICLIIVLYFFKNIIRDKR